MTSATSRAPVGCSSSTAIESRLDLARGRGAEAVDFNTEDPVAVVQELTGGVGVDRVIDAVGVDAQRPRRGPAAEAAEEQAATLGSRGVLLGGRRRGLHRRGHLR